MQAELAALSSRGEHRVLEGASHVGTMTDPGTMREVVEIVRRIVEAARRKPWRAFVALSIRTFSTRWQALGIRVNRRNPPPPS